MKKRILVLFTLILSLFILTSCAGNANSGDNQSGAGSEDIGIILPNVNRKIIYTASLSIKTNNLLETTNQVKNNLTAEDWIEKEELGSKSNYITIRIKTERLNSFIESLKTEHQTTNFNLESKDVSLDYLDQTARKNSLESERARLVELFETASINDMIFINRRIGELDSELLKLNRQLLEFDSLINYSTVKIWIHGPTADPNPPGLGGRLHETLKAGWDTVLKVGESLIHMIVFLLPFSLIVGPIGALTIVGRSHYRKRKIKRNLEEREKFLKKLQEESNKEDNNDKNLEL